MPWFQVNGERSGPLVAALVNITSGVIEDPEHWNDTVGRSIGATDVGAGGTNAVNIDTNPTCGFGY